MTTCPQSRSCFAGNSRPWPDFRSPYVHGEIPEFQQMDSDGVQQVMLKGGGSHWVTVCKTDSTFKLLDSENIGLSPELSSHIVTAGREDEHRSMDLEVQLPKMHPQRGSSDYLFFFYCDTGIMFTISKITLTWPFTCRFLEIFGCIMSSIKTKRVRKQWNKINRGY